MADVGDKGLRVCQQGGITSSWQLPLGGAQLDLGDEKH